jgi:flagellar M-ring protein FliF
MRSEQVQEEKRVGNLGAIGVPGALSNQPSLQGTAPETLSSEEQSSDSVNAQGIPSSSSKQSTRNFELDRTISHTRVAPGAIRKLSVAVLVDERREAGSDVTIPLSEAEMTRINALIMDAIGFSKARGDSLNIVNAAFLTPQEAEPLPELAIWEQVWIWDVAKQVLGGLLVLFLIFGVIRPAFKDLNKVDPASAAMQANIAAGRNPEMGRALANKGGQAEGARITTGSEDVEGQLSNVRSLVQQDPALVAQVVKNWTMSES